MDRFIVFMLLSRCIDKGAHFDIEKVFIPSSKATKNKHPYVSKSVGWHK